MIGPYESSEEVVLSHKWRTEGKYIINARAIDPDNHWGPSGELEVKMPLSLDSIILQLLNHEKN
jgi:hypothetical protein